MVIHGLFNPPLLGDRHAPVPIGGQGHLEARASGLRAVGRRTTRGTSLLLTVAVLLLIASAPVAHHLGMSRGLAIAFAAGVAILLVGFGTQRTRRSAGPYELDVPWANVRSVEHHRGALIVLVGGDVSGGIYFRPKDLPSKAQLVAAIEARVSIQG